MATEESENTEQFLWDGRTLYVRIVEEVHSETKRTLKERKQTKARARTDE